MLVDYSSVEAATVTNPLMIHLGEEHECICKDAQVSINEALRGAICNSQVFTYPHVPGAPGAVPRPRVP